MQKNSTWVVAKEFILKNLLSWGYWIKLLTPVLIFGAVFFITYLVVNGGIEAKIDNPDVVAVVGEFDYKDEVIDNANKKEDRVTIYESYEDRSLAEKYVNSGELQGYILVEDESAILYVQKDSPDITNFKQAMYQNQLTKIVGRRNLSEDELAVIQAGSYNIVERKIGQEDVNETLFELKDVVAYIIGIIVFIVLVNYANMIIQEIALERGTKVIEIVMSSVSPVEHFNGKILGTVVLVCIDLLVYSLITLVVVVVTVKTGILNSFVSEGILSLGGDFLPILLFGLVYLGLSVVLYVLIALWLGLSANRLEDAQKLSGPLVMVSLIGFYINIYSSALPDGLLNYLGLFPLFTAVVGPKVLAGEFSYLWAIIYLVILGASVCMLYRYIGKRYKELILVYNNKNWVTNLILKGQ